MHLYSCFFGSFTSSRSREDSWSSSDSTVSTANGSTSPDDREQCTKKATLSSYGKIDIELPLLRPVAVKRQESFKRSRSFMESPSSATNNVEPTLANSQALLQKLSIHDKSKQDVAPVQQQQQQIRGVKRGTTDRFNIVPTTTTTTTQIEVAHRIANFLMKSCKGSKEPEHMFIGEQIPAISFSKYVERLVKFTNRWAEEPDGADSLGIRCAVIAVLLLERVNVVLTCKAIHRYFMSAYLIAIKSIYDYYISNAFWGDVAGCPVHQVNRMELEFCNELKWNIVVSEDLHEIRLNLFIASPS